MKFDGLLVSLPLLALSALGVYVGCAEEGGAGTPALDYSALLRDVTEQAAWPAHQRAADSAAALLQSVSALREEPSAESLLAARDAWRTARADFRQLDAFKFGPINTTGIDIRIDATPADPSAIERLLAGDDAVDRAAVGRLGGKRKGYLALEHLLFVDSQEGDVLTRLGSEPRRAALAVSIAEEIRDSTAQLRDAWDPAGGGFARELIEAGAGEGTYRNQRVALDDLVAGGGYALELVVGIRLAMPLGRKTSGNPEPEHDPTRASDSAVADMLASMRGVRSLYESVGFSSLIRPQSASLDDEALRQLGDCERAIEAIPRPFDASVTGQTAIVQAAFEACKIYKFTWNTDITSTLGATVLPLDTDGD